MPVKLPASDRRLVLWGFAIILIIIVVGVRVAMEK